MAVATGCTKSFAPRLIYPEFQTKLRWLGKHRQSSAKRTDEASRGGASSSDRRRNCPQDVPENAGLHLKRLGAVVLIVSRRHHDNEIEFRDDANRLPAATKRASPVDLTPVERGAAEPP